MRKTTDVDDGSLTPEELQIIFADRKVGGHGAVVKVAAYTQALGSILRPRLVFRLADIRDPNPKGERRAILVSGRKRASRGQLYRRLAQTFLETPPATEGQAFNKSVDALLEQYTTSSPAARSSKTREIVAVLEGRR